MNGSLAGLRVAIVHYWFVGIGGGERVVEAIAEIFPEADIFALIVDRNAMSPALRNRNVTSSFLQKIPKAKYFYRHLLPLQPFALEQFDLTDYDLVISSESGPAKGVLTLPSTCHICYCHTPMRYLWDMYHDYRCGMGRISRAIFSSMALFLRQWDLASAARVDHFVANSRFVASRIRKYYGRESTVIHPPVSIHAPGPTAWRGDHYLVVGRLTKYKRVDLAIAACNRLGVKLRIVGAGPEYKALRRMAGPTIEFTGCLSDADVAQEYAGSRALLFPGEEDFGIVPVEAQMSGRPVIAFGSGGALETISGLWPHSSWQDGATGLFFDAQTTHSLATAIRDFERVEHRFSPEAIRRHTHQFEKAKFQRRFLEFTTERLAQSSLRAFRALTAKDPLCDAHDDPLKIEVLQTTSEGKESEKDVRVHAATADD